MRANPAPDLVQSLVDIGVRDGDSVVIHSSMRSIGRVRDGAQGVVASLLAVLGRSGTLVAPTFNYHVPAKGIVDLRTQSCSTGAIAEVLRQHPDARRSSHPTHSVVAMGGRADHIVEGHSEGSAMGRESPLGRLASIGGKILLLGVGQVANTTLHVAEEVASRPKGRISSDPVVFIDGSGARRERVPDPSPSCSAGFGAAESKLRELNLIKDGRVGAALAQMMTAEAVIHSIAQSILRDAEFMLCNWNGCTRCSYTRLAASQHVRLLEQCL